MAMTDTQVRAGMTVTEDSTGRLGMITEPVGPRRGFAAVIWEGDSYAVRGWASEMTPAKVLVLTENEALILQEWAAYVKNERPLDEQEQELLNKVNKLV